MEKQFDEICNRLGIGNERNMIRPVFKAGFDAGVDHAERKFDEETEQLERAVAALGL